MGQQSARMFFQGKDHKDIWFDGHYHDKVYQGSQLLWEKLDNDRIFIGSGFATCITKLQEKFFVFTTENEAGSEKRILCAEDIKKIAHIGNTTLYWDQWRVGTGGVVNMADTVLCLGGYLIDKDGRESQIILPAQIEDLKGYTNRIVDGQEIVYDILMNDAFNVEGEPDKSISIYKTHDYQNYDVLGTMITGDEKNYHPPYTGRLFCFKGNIYLNGYWRYVSEGVIKNTVPGIYLANNLLNGGLIIDTQALNGCGMISSSGDVAVFARRNGAVYFTYDMENFLQETNITADWNYDAIRNIEARNGYVFVTFEYVDGYAFIVYSEFLGEMIRSEVFSKRYGSKNRKFTYLIEGEYIALGTYYTSEGYDSKPFIRYLKITDYLEEGKTWHT